VLLTQDSYLYVVIIGLAHGPMFHLGTTGNYDDRFSSGNKNIDISEQLISIELLIKRKSGGIFCIFSYINRLILCPKNNGPDSH
jgi:hypothetical protein